MKEQQLYNCNCLDILKDMDFEKVIIVSDPPFNIGYKYNTYKAKKKKLEMENVWVD